MTYLGGPRNGRVETMVAGSQPHCITFHDPGFSFAPGVHWYERSGDLYLYTGYRPADFAITFD